MNKEELKAIDQAGFSRSYWVNANIIYNGDRTKIIK